jgi:nicotinamide-nucleotide amidase
VARHRTYAFYVGRSANNRPSLFQLRLQALDGSTAGVIGEAAVLAMAHGVRRLLHADVGIATTGVAGPTEQEGHPPGTVWIGLTTNDRDDAVRLRLPGDRDRVRQFSAISLMDRLRRSLLT